VAASQTITVLDLEQKTPLAFATISSHIAGVFTTTDDSGRADISAFRDASAIEFRSIGYKAVHYSYDELLGDSLVVYMQHMGLEFDHIVVRATRLRQDSRDVPFKTVSISKLDALLTQDQTTADLLSSTGAVFIQKSQQGGGSPMIRGFSTNRLLYAVDDVRMNTAIFRSGNLQNVISIDPYTIERADVYLGPGSVIYGSDAIGGVMSFKTLAPKLGFSDSTIISTNFDSRYSTINNEITGHIDVNFGWEKWATVTSISANHFGDLRAGKNGPVEYLRPFYVQRVGDQDVEIQNKDPYTQVPSGYDQINAMQKIRFKPNDKLEISYGLHYSSTSTYSRYDRNLLYHGGLPRYGEWNYGPQKWLMNHLRIEHYSKSTYYDKVILSIAHQNFEESRISRDFNASQKQRRIENVAATSVNLDLVKSFAGSNQLFYGGEFVKNRVKSIGKTEDIFEKTVVDGPSRYPNAKWQSIGAYLSYQHQLGSFSFLSGLRYNQYILDSHFDTRFYPLPQENVKSNHGALVGSLGTLFRPSEDLVLSLNLATGFRAPNVDDAGKVFDSEPGSVVIPNAELMAEYAYNIEVGITKIFVKNLRLEFNAYYTILDNAMVRRNATLNGLDSIFYDGQFSQVQSIQNAAMATVLGFQMNAKYSILQGRLLFTADLNLQEGKEELEDGSESPSRHAAPTFGTIAIAYKGKKIRIKSFLAFCGGKPFEDLPQEEQGKKEIYAIDSQGNPFSPSWTTLNLNASYSLSGKWSINVGLENITNQLYRTFSSGIAAGGRNLVLALHAEI